MDQFTQHMPYDYLGKRTIKIDKDRIVIDSKNMLRTISDEYRYEKINPEFKTVRRGEKEWGNIVYGLIVSTIVLFLFLKMFHSGLLTLIVYALQLSMISVALYLVSLGYFKRNFIYVLDTSGDCIFALKETARSKEFLKKLKAQVEKAGPKDAAR